MSTAVLSSPLAAESIPRCGTLIQVSDVLRRINEEEYQKEWGESRVRTDAKKWQSTSSFTRCPAITHTGARTGITTKERYGSCRQRMWRRIGTRSRTDFYCMNPPAFPANGCQGKNRFPSIISLNIPSSHRVFSQDPRAGTGQYQHRFSSRRRMGCPYP